MRPLVFFRSPFDIADPESPRQMRQAAQIRVLAGVNTGLSGACLALVGALLWFYCTPAAVPRALAGSSARAVYIPRELVLSVPVTDGKTAQAKDLFEPAQTAQGVGVVDFLSQYKVVGIILDRDSQAVLRDRQTGKSLFVRQGDRLGGAEVTEIKEGKVVLSSEGHNWELRP
jgi:hypothetical protein